MAGQSKLITDPEKLRSTKRRYIKPVIELERPIKRELQKDEFITYKLRSDPTKKDSLTYELTVPYFDTGTPEEMLLFMKAIH